MKSKYRAKRTECDGIVFASKKEAKRYWELRLLERDGTIEELQIQKRYDLHSLGGVKVCSYVADFVYRAKQRNLFGWNEELVVEDVKGFRTPLYRLKKKMMKAEYGITILET